MVKRVVISTLIAVALLAGPGTQVWGALTGPNEGAGQARVIRWIDGDTVLTDAGKVRLVGIDTPEKGRCGYDAARKVSERVAPAGTTVDLALPDVAENDRHGRMLRYVDTGRADVGAVQVEAGAWARYDSRDGYRSHPNQREYRLMDREHRNYCGTAHP